MQAGKLDKRITLQQLVAGQDAYGEPVHTWTDVATVWASIDDLTGRQYLAAQAAQNAVQTKITIRYRAGIVPAMRVLHGTDVFDIEAVLGQDRVMLTLMCTKGVNNG